ncbi:zinc finger protein 154-like [Odontomachus brunneus]|uniref:zinc finger protein 154-like n=1 Tax=Odontomachus brunneus TaxID=486640 RepID=UPI0013F1DFA3|nr:zinc finger protein 154-like [Odontomachus brunneus]
MEDLDPHDSRSRSTISSDSSIFARSLLGGFFAGLSWSGDGSRRTSRSASIATTTASSSSATATAAATSEVPAPLAPQRRPRLHCPSRHVNRNNNQSINSSISGLTHDRRHTCSRCGKSYKNAYILKRHMLYECGKAPSFSCPHCSFSSKYERNLKAHINHRHVDLHPTMPGLVVNRPCRRQYPHLDYNKPFVCDRCGRRYKLRWSLHCHKRDECGKEPRFKCYYCNYWSKIRSNWIRHEKIHTNPYSRSWLLEQKHKIRLSNVPEKFRDLTLLDKRYTCDTCGKSYKWKESLCKHQRIECRKQPQFICKICGYRFMHKHHLTKHVTRIHFERLL